MNELTRVGVVAFVALVAAGSAGSRVVAHGGGSAERQFARVSTFVVCENTSCDRDVVEETVAEIVAASDDGRTLAYADAAMGAVGFVDIADPEHPQGRGVVDVHGQPTSVAVAGPWMLVAVNTSASFVSPSGQLQVFDLATCAADAASCAPEVVHELDGQPDSVAISPDRRFAAVAIENERDEDVEVGGVEGGLPQLPAGNLKVVRLGGHPLEWTIRTVDLTGLTPFAPEDPEPEYVSINEWNVAAVTLQENNHVVLVYLPTASVVHHFPAGSVTGTGFDTDEDDLIEPVGELVDRPREPDAVAWLGLGRLVTANEGDLFGGTRGFTIFGAGGRALFDSGRDLESIAQRHGHYPEGRSDAKGTEPEGIATARFDGRELIFVGSERGNFVAVYEDAGIFGPPRFRQLLPTGIGPEGLLPIPGRGLFVTAAETDDDGEVRSQITIFRLQHGPTSYPQVVSGPRLRGPLAGQAPIGWVALSALAADRSRPDRLFTAHDAFLKESRLYVLDVSRKPAVIRDEIPLLKDGAPVSYDVEGLVQRAEEGFWVASEGAGNFPTVTRENLLVRVGAGGAVQEEISLPASVAGLQRSNGFEGVAVVGAGEDERVFVAFQREWTGDPARHVRIGEYRPANGEWRFFYYPIDPVESPTADWVGLSEIVALSGDRLLVLERDNAGGPDARNKRLYSVSIAGVEPQPQGTAFPVLTKTLALDLLPALRASRGWTQEKVEGVAVTADRRLYIVTDNDGVDENTGETLLLRLGKTGARD
jgi:hypothetical protein